MKSSFVALSFAAACVASGYAISGCSRSTGVYTDGNGSAAAAEGGASTDGATPGDGASPDRTTASDAQRPASTDAGPVDASGPCGHFGEVCCGRSNFCWAPNGCVSGRCQPCGRFQEACCDGTAPCHQTYGCIGGRCERACGAEYQQCCFGQTCTGTGLSCVGDTCLAPTACGDPLPPVRTEFLPRCAAATRTCLDGCVTAQARSQCESACREYDQTPPAVGTHMDCEWCLYYSVKQCAEANGCHASRAAFECCKEQMCPPGSDWKCDSIRCRQESDAASACYWNAAMSAACAGATAQCFAAM